MRIATVLAVAFVGATCLADAEHAQAAIRHYQLNIPRQSLDMALKDLAQQTGLQIGRFSERIDGSAMVGPVEGTQTPAEALNILLRHTGLDYKVVSDTTFAVYNPKAVDSINKLDGKAPSGGNSQNCSGISRNKPDSATTLNWTDSDSMAIGWTASDGTSDCADGRFSRNQVRASAQSSGEGGSAQNSDGESSLKMDSTQDTKLEEIVVTAQRRTEALQDVPISISVLGGDELDSSTFSGVSDALRTVPGLVASTDFSTQSGSYALRGVPGGGNASGAGSLAYYIDGVPFGFVRSGFYPADPSIFDLERIEVLAGPQGTLYGANALNGVIRVLTADPDLDAFGFKARTSLSGTDGGEESYGGDFAVNVPLIDGRLAVRAVAGFRDDGGWIDAPYGSDINASDSENYRLKLAARLTDTLSIGASAWRSKLRMDAPSQSGENLRVTTPSPEPVEQEFDAYGFNIDKEFDGFSVSSQTSYISFHSFHLVDGRPAQVPFKLNNVFDSDVFSEEINLISDSDGPWRWSTGAFYREGEDRKHQLLLSVATGGTSVNDDFTDVSKSYAVYGEIGRSLPADLDLAVGLRYFHDDQAMRVNQFYPAASTLPVGVDFEATSEAVTPRAVLTWKPVPEHSLYTSYSQGFRSGFAQQPRVQQVFASSEQVDPDTLTNYEIGAKGSLFGGRLAYEAAAYYITWEDVQRSIQVLLGNSLSTIAMVNSGEANGPGASVSLTARPVDGFEIGGNVSWNDVTYDQDVFSGTSLIGRRGERISLPEYTASLFTSYEWQLAGGFSANASVNANYRGSYEGSPFLGQFPTAESALFAGARLTIGAPENWSATLFIDNLTNVTDSEMEIFQIPFNLSSEWEARLRPRTYGIQLSYRY